MALMPAAVCSTGCGASGHGETSGWKSFASQTDSALRGLHAVLVILAEPAISSEPCERAFHYPRQTDNFEGAVLAFDDLQLPAFLTHQLSRQLTALVPGIGHDSLNSREEWTQTGEQSSSRDSIRHVGGLHSACD